MSAPLFEQLAAAQPINGTVMPAGNVLVTKRDSKLAILENPAHFGLPEDQAEVIARANALIEFAIVNNNINTGKALWIYQQLSRL